MRTDRFDEVSKERNILGGVERTLGRSLLAPAWIVPAVNLEQCSIAGKKEQCLVWGFPGGVRPASSARGLLERFLKLRNANERTILRFAQSWGVLGLCEHGMPFTHNLYYEVTVLPAIWKPCHPCRKEPIRLWRARANKAYEIVHEAAALLGEPPLSKIPPSERESTREKRQYAWSRVIGSAQDWLKESAASWSLFVPRGKEAGSWGQLMLSGTRRLQLVADFPMMFDALAFQLCQAITRSEGLLICAGCNQAFFRAWKPRVGKRVFCRACGRNASMRLYMREKRARSKTVSKQRVK